MSIMHPGINGSQPATCNHGLLVVESFTNFVSVFRFLENQVHNLATFQCQVRPTSPTSPTTWQQYIRRSTQSIVDQVNLLNGQALGKLGTTNQRQHCLAPQARVSPETTSCSCLFQFLLQRFFHRLVLFRPYQGPLEKLGNLKLGLKQCIYFGEL